MTPNYMEKVGPKCRKLGAFQATYFQTIPDSELEGARMSFISKFANMRNRVGAQNVKLTRYFGAFRALFIYVILEVKLGDPSRLVFLILQGLTELKT